jgi:hypothetical protein
MMPVNIGFQTFLGGADTASMPKMTMLGTRCSAQAKAVLSLRELKLTPEHRDAKLRVFLPPKAGFVHVHLTNRRSGAAISGMQVSLSPMESPGEQQFSMGCDSNHVVLVQPDKNLLLHVTSDGFREWDESVGKGKPLHLTSGSQLTLDIKLEPLD